MSFKIVEKWTSSGKTFKVGDHVVLEKYLLKKLGIITSIEVCNKGDGHVVLDGDRNTLTNFYFVDFDKSYYREEKLKELGI